MLNPPLKFRQSSIIYKKAGHLPEKLKLWRDPTTIEFNIFLLKLCAPFHHQYLPKDVHKVIHKPIFVSVQKPGLFYIGK